MADREQDQLLATATDRFERRLSETIGGVRLTMVEQDSLTRLEIAKVQIDMAEQFAASRTHTEARHRELLKWAFVFWVGQAIAVAGMFKAFT